jgi:LPXTG-motif cell wall-anchored protein
MTIVEGYTATSSAVFTLNERFSPTVTLSNDFGGKITWNNTTKRLDIAAGIPAGTYTFTLTASGGRQTVSQDFTLTVNSLPVLIPETGDKLTVPALALAFAMLGITSITQSKKRRTTH